MANESTLIHNINSEEFFNLFSELKTDILRLSNQQVEKQPSEGLMTTEQVAVYFHKHKDTIENWTNRGYLYKYGLGRAVFYKRSEVESAVVPLSTK